jgi:hypothetical protein
VVEAAPGGTGPPAAEDKTEHRPATRLEVCVWGRGRGEGRRREDAPPLPEGMTVVCPTRLRTPRKAILEESCPP